MKYYGVDTETEDKLLKERGTSWAFGEGHVIVTGVYDAQTKKKIPLDGSGGKEIYKLLTDPAVTLVGARIIYDLGWFCYEHKMRARDVKCSLIDVALVESVIDEYQKYALDDLAWKYLHERKGSEYLATWARSKGFKGDFRKYLSQAWDEVPDKVREYVLSDADQPYRIWEKQKEIIEARGLWEPVIRKNKLIKVMLAMKQRGVRIDVKKKAENYVVLKGHQDRLNAEFEEKHGKVNIGSTKQLAELFTDNDIPFRHKIRIKSRIGGDAFVGEDLWNERKRLKNAFAGVRVIKGQLVIFVARQYAARTAAELKDMGYDVTNNPNIDKKALEALRKTHPLAQEIVDLKQVTSIIDKFMGPKFDRFICPDGRIRCDFNISGARQTSRLSSSAPNLQQVPSKTVLFRKTDHEINLAKMCREVIIPDDGMFIGKMDYSGQENVLMAHFAVGPGSKEIRKKYHDNPEFDFHGYMGEATGLYEEFGPEVGRKYAKNCSFGLGYGMQITTMMENFGWDKDQAEHIMEVYNDAAPFVRATMDAVSETIVQRGFIRTLGGKQLHLQKFRGKVDTRSAYKGFNKLIQGSAADMMEEALVKIYEAGLDDYFPLYLTVHDEIDFGVPKTREALKKLGELKYIMEHAILKADGTPALLVPIRVDPELGYNWGSMHDFAKNKAKFMKKVAA